MTAYLLLLDAGPESCAAMSAVPARTQAHKLRRGFYQEPADALARALIGKILVHRTGQKEYRGRIVETEAYMGPNDLASHSSKGRTKRTEVMFGPAGHAYVYFIYGMYEMFNIVAGTTGKAHAVLVRAAEPMDGWEADLSGPGKLARAFELKRSDNGLDLTGSKLFLLDNPGDQAKIAVSPRIGIDYAKHWVSAPLRFFDANSPAVSKTRSAPPKR
ncbi:MAG TPA: DNA-3-methyladenine glycosylase [Tepidisphaeraceae bacterium]|jgi:DNA-3-methyladenine glycosylase|nr:DNA-3-methyladenine glycosylase [Tepidisphaeraceae bacterium]